MVNPFNRRNVSAQFILDCLIVKCMDIELQINEDLEHFER